MKTEVLDKDGLIIYDEEIKKYIQKQGIGITEEQVQGMIEVKLSDEIIRAEKAESELSIKKLDKTTVASSSTLGLIKSGTDITVDASGNVSVNDDSHNHVISNVDGLQSALDGKAATGHTHDDRYYTESEIDSKLSGKANSSHGTHVPSTCTTITDWNSATTTGWYMGSSASNAPSTAWYFGYVIAHNTNYVIQEVYQFTASTDAKAIPKYIRAKMNGTWGSWTDVTVQKKVPSDPVFTNTWRGIQDNLPRDSITDSLSAAQGKVLKGLVDGKASSSHTHSVYVNQNAFSNVVVGSTTIAADSATDTLTLVAGSNVVLTTDATNDKITIATTNTENTAGSTNTSSKIFLVGATSQAASPQTYSHDTVYVGTDGCLYSNSTRVVNEVISSTEPSGQINGDYWLLSY